MPFIEKTVGFDARKLGLDRQTHWPVERRDRFLLRQDADPVLSTDELVWPSVFHTDQLPLARASELEALGLHGPQRPAWVGPNPPLWAALGNLKAHLAKTAAQIETPYWIIAVTVILAADQPPSGRGGPTLEQTRPARVSAAWPRLGYDVSDGSLLSGLTNCGYQPGERHRPRLDTLAQYLNRWHLFDAPEPAVAFRALADARIREHAPFLVYGLYQVGQQKG